MRLTFAHALDNKGRISFGYVESASLVESRARTANESSRRLSFPAGSNTWKGCSFGFSSSNNNGGDDHRRYHMLLGSFFWTKRVYKPYLNAAYLGSSLYSFYNFQRTWKKIQPEKHMS